MSRRKPSEETGPSTGQEQAVPPPAKLPEWLCACCGEPVADAGRIDIVQDGSRLTAITPRGRAALVLWVDGVVEVAEATLLYEDALRLVEAFSKKQDLIVARRVEEDL